MVMVVGYRGVNALEGNQCFEMEISGIQEHADWREGVTHKHRDQFAASAGTTEIPGIC